MNSETHEVNNQTAIIETERRLRRYPSLKTRIQLEKRELTELGELNLEKIKTSSKSIIARQSRGVRLSPIEAHAAQVAAIRLKVNRDTNEARILHRALETIADDKYYRTIPLYYFKGMNDYECAEIMRCSRSTARRHRLRLVNALAEILR